MYQIKIRVWDGEKMIYPGRVELINDQTPSGVNIPLRDGGYCGVTFDSGQVMLGSGIKDRNGREIYDKDIVHFDYADKLIAEVIYQPGGFYFKWLNKRCAEVRGKETEPILSNISLWEIIGNRFENPELLEGGQS